MAATGRVSWFLRCFQQSSRYFFFSLHDNRVFVCQQPFLVNNNREDKSEGKKKKTQQRKKSYPTCTHIHKTGPRKFCGGIIWTVRMFSVTAHKELCVEVCIKRLSVTIIITIIVTSVKSGTSAGLNSQWCDCSARLRCCRIPAGRFRCGVSTATPPPSLL